MRNIEKYKDEIVKADKASITCSVTKFILGLPCYSNCSECKKNVMDWLLEEYSEPLLNDAEREYLSAIIKPFRGKHEIHITKKVSDILAIKNAYISVKVGSDRINFPFFNKDKMYEGMKKNKEYTLKELDL